MGTIVVVLLETFIVFFVVFVVAEVVAGFLPKYFKQFVRGLVCLWMGVSLFNTGVFGEWKQTPPQTVATLMEQVRGDALHWNSYGKPATKWEGRTHRYYKRTCQSYAIEQLGELGPAASEAVPELIQLFKELEDYNSGDGVYELPSDIARTLGKIGSAEAIAPMVSMLIMKSLSPDLRGRSSIHWHDREYENGRSYLKRGTGPQAILMALMLMPLEHHGEIVDQLRSARTQIEQSDLFNDWSKFEIDRGIRFFEYDEKTKRRIRNSVASYWCLDEPTVEKSAEAKSVRPPQKYIVQLSNGKWSKEVSTEAEVQEILAEDRKASALRQ